MTFMGLTKDDFGELVGSSWRRRDSLGGELATRLRDFVGPDCESWGVRRRLELHLARRAHYDFADPYPCPKLFVYTSDDALTYGFYVEGDSSGEFPAWEQFRSELRRQTPLRETVQAVIAKHSLSVGDYYQMNDGGGAIGRRFRAVNGRLQVSPPGERPKWAESSFADLFKAIGGANGKTWVDLHIFAQISMDDAIRLKRAVIDRIAPVLADLAPVYRECATGLK